MSDPFRQAEPALDVRAALRESADWLIELFFERATAEAALPPAERAVRGEPAAGSPEPLVGPRRVRLPKGRRVACVSLVAGCGTTTVAALLAQRSGGAGARVTLVDLDLAAPSLAVLAGRSAPTVAEALADPALEGRRWGSADVLYGAAHELDADAADALGALVSRLALRGAVVVDAGVLVAPACRRVLAACDTVLYVTTPRAAHVHAAARAATLLRDLAIAARLVVVRAQPDPARAVAAEVGLPLAGALPEDPFLARDDFRVRAETARAVDLLCAALHDRA